MAILPAAAAERARAQILRRMPPTHSLAVTTGTPRTVTGYVKASKGSLDVLGNPERDAVMHVVTGSIAVGDELGQYVVWEELDPELWPRWALRTLPPFQAWTTEAWASAGTDPETLGPLPAARTTGTASVYVLPGSAREGLEAGGSVVQRRAIGLCRTSLARGTELEHAVLGRYKVAASTPYGPWFALSLEVA